MNPKNAVIKTQELCALAHFMMVVFPEYEAQSHLSFVPEARGSNSSSSI